MAVEEIIDKESGAILFKKGKEAQKIELLEAQVKELEDRISRLEKFLHIVTE